MRKEKVEKKKFERRKRRKLCQVGKIKIERLRNKEKVKGGGKKKAKQVGEEKGAKEES